MTESTNRGPKGSVSRRDFIKGSGAVAAATATALATQQAIADDQGPDAVKSGPQTITLKVNGALNRVTVEPRTTLLEVLRYDLDLTGAKPVSTNDGTSGASTVMVDGKPMAASTLLAIACDRKEIQTVEDLGGNNPDEIPLAFVEHDAQQCGFCTPGFVVAVRAFLNKNPHATEAEIRQGLNGNICRCGTYAHIIQAALSCVKGGA